MAIGASVAAAPIGGSTIWPVKPTMTKAAGATPVPSSTSTTTTTTTTTTPLASVRLQPVGSRVSLRTNQSSMNWGAAAAAAPAPTPPSKGTTSARNRVGGGRHVVAGDSDDDDDDDDAAPLPVLTPRTARRFEPAASSVDTVPSWRRDAERDAPVTALGDGLSGLRNLGNTCFMNAVVQCVRHAPGILALCHAFHDLAPPRNTPLSTAAVHLFDNVWSGNDAVVAPAAFKRCVGSLGPRFLGYDQQDAHEFLVFLVDTMHEELKAKPLDPVPPAAAAAAAAAGNPAESAATAWATYRRRNDSPLADLFGGILKSTLTCTVCKHASVTFDPSWGLSLPLPTDTTRPLTLQDCFNLFQAPELLTGDEQPTCEKCKARRPCTKQLALERWPEVLVVQLKRFQHTAYSRIKLTNSVTAPVSGLNLAGSAQIAPYDLFGVVNHTGGLGGGHYYGHCKHPGTAAWGSFNDSSAGTCDIGANVQGPAPYLLFYQLRQARPSKL